jgi:hypothetical protein
MTDPAVHPVKAAKRAVEGESANARLKQFGSDFEFTRTALQAMDFRIPPNAFDRKEDVIVLIDKT